MDAATLIAGWTSAVDYPGMLGHGLSIVKDEVVSVIAAGLCVRILQSILISVRIIKAGQ